MGTNLFKERWEKRYAVQPPEIKRALDELNDKCFEDYELGVIKRKRVIPQTGDVFLVMPKPEIIFWGVVLKGDIECINGTQLAVIGIFKQKAKSIYDEKPVFDYSNFLLAPETVGKENWTRGYFYNTGHKENIPDDLDYGFYRLANNRFVDVYGNKLDREPSMWNAFGVATVSGVAHGINEELIFNREI